MTKKRHRWDEAGYDISSRTCLDCGLDAHRSEPGSSPWMYQLGDFYQRHGLVPPCPPVAKED